MHVRVLKTSLVLLVLLGLVACSSKHEQSPSRQGLATEVANVAAPAAKEGPRQYLAYERSIVVETEEDKIAAVFAAMIEACKAAEQDACVVLESRLETGRSTYANIKFRAKPNGIHTLETSVSGQGRITSRNSAAEDLAQPLEDAAKKLEMLSDYRRRLEALKDKAGSEVDSLIKLSKELAQVQAEIEALQGNRAYLVQRVETEILHVSITADSGRSFWRPVLVAARDFLGNFSQGISSVITALAFILPWGATVLAFVWLGRKLWLRRRRVEGIDPRAE